jgi:hypothetical protein
MSKGHTMKNKVVLRSSGSSEIGRGVMMDHPVAHSTGKCAFFQTLLTGFPRVAPWVWKTERIRQGKIYFCKHFGVQWNLWLDSSEGLSKGLETQICLNTMLLRKVWPPWRILQS